MGFDILVSFFDSLFSSLRTGNLRFMVFEAGEFTVYSNKCCVPDNEDKNDVEG